jgi:hypothetical protein
MNKKGSVALIILGLVAVIALVGLILLFAKGSATGQSVSSYTCTDTEDVRNDIDVYHTGTVTYAGGGFTDTCADNRNNAVEGAGPKLIEYYCRGGAMFTTVQRCPFGCVNGACLMSDQGLAFNPDY